MVIDNLVSIFLKQHPQGTVTETSQPTYMFVTEGVLMYLSEQQVKDVFDKLIENFSDSIFLFDSMSLLIIKNQQHHDSVKHMSANFDWRLFDTREIQNWNFGYQVMEFVTFANHLIFKYILLLRNACYLAIFQLT